MADVAVTDEAVQEMIAWAKRRLLICASDLTATVGIERYGPLVEMLEQLQSYRRAASAGGEGVEAARQIIETYEFLQHRLSSQGPNSSDTDRASASHDAALKNAVIVARALLSTTEEAGKMAKEIESVIQSLNSIKRWSENQSGSCPIIEQIATKSEAHCRAVLSSYRKQGGGK